MSTVSVNEKDFTKEISGSEVPVLVDFYASWCMPCRMLSPVLESLSEELSGRAKFLKVNVDEEPELAERYHIQSVPTMIVFRDGNAADRMVGAVGKEQIRSLIGV